MRLVLLLLLACSPRIVRVPVSTTQDIRIVSMPEREHCWLSEPPTPPELLELKYDEEDVVRRVFLHYLQANEIIQFERDMALWMGETRACVYQMLGQEP